MTQTQAAAHPLSRACALSVPTSLLPPFKSARERHLRSTRALCAHRRRQSEPHAARTRSFGLACTCCRLLRLRRRTAREPSQPLVPKGTRAASRGLCPGRRRGFAGWFRRLAARPRGCRHSKFRHEGGLSRHHGPARSSNCHPTKISRRRTAKRLHTPLSAHDSRDLVLPDSVSQKEEASGRPKKLGVGVSCRPCWHNFYSEILVRGNGSPGYGDRGPGDKKHVLARQNDQRLYLSGC